MEDLPEFLEGLLTPAVQSLLVLALGVGLLYVAKVRGARRMLVSLAAATVLLIGGFWSRDVALGLVGALVPSATSQSSRYWYLAAVGREANNALFMEALRKTTRSKVAVSLVGTGLLWCAFGSLLIMLSRVEYADSVEWVGAGIVGYAFVSTVCSLVTYERYFRRLKASPAP